MKDFQNSVLSNDYNKNFLPFHRMNHNGPRLIKSIKNKDISMFSIQSGYFNGRVTTVSPVDVS